MFTAMLTCILEDSSKDVRSAAVGACVEVGDSAVLAACLEEGHCADVTRKKPVADALERVGAGAAPHVRALLGSGHWYARIT